MVRSELIVSLHAKSSTKADAMKKFINKEDSDGILKIGEQN